MISRTAGPLRSFRLRVERLEERRMLDGNLLVTTPLDVADPDDGILSLREALLGAKQSADGDVIQFDESLAGATIQLDPALGSLVVDSDADMLIFFLLEEEEDAPVDVILEALPDLANLAPMTRDM